ncbi:Malate-2H(+)/Na(+)-lactate antiporter [Slackia heliotrinireducens]|uniref:Na+/H+ antiporter n=1 Tax=Slackia heliotrinireducens (strain ATCC 29202 / DSM 20476 / NCTC 11029 / RHS 1) TaxID=471855 RepID=C7N3Q3_SLAHD|nr:Na+/H+ antiporter NhaC family protein [Slackia heliotrinireducens]ACV21644.1 Na+/H+ antiporter [Slackia heliotrinireducens DSM 20476]VEG99228.1 Malate-2H(+)/Na(+)-lactate antiporter [Slackia heliotrinireducens]
MEFAGTFWALVPPLVAIVLALITKETFSSLFVGILVGALLLANFNIIDTVNYIILGTIGEGDDAMGVGFINAISDPWNAGIFIFLVMLGIIVALINVAGGSAAFGAWAAKHIKTRVGASLATFLLGVLIFVDDYFNCLTVGAVMRPVTDVQKISRAKLSYIIDATAAPICMIAPISSWAAAVSATAADLDTGITGIQLFVQAIPYNFYSLLTIVFVVGICILGFDYGPMAKAEFEAYKNGQLGSLGNEEVVDNKRASLWDMLVPVILLIVFCILGMLYIGGFWDPEAEGYMSLTLAFGNTDASVGLPWGSLIAVILSFIYLVARRVVSFKDATGCFVDGFKAMVPAMLILTFALTLKLTTSALGADVYVAGLMEGAADSLFKMLPAIIFLVAVGLAFSTGTSWGTFGILIPIVLPIFSNDPTLLTIGISACLAGAVCGDHISPISDTTIMASAGANVNHVDHVSTQLPYALTVAGVSFVCFIIAGFVQNPFICLALGVVLVIATLFVLRATVGKKSLEDRAAHAA